MIDKVELKKENYDHYHPPGHKSEPILFMRPFFKSRQGKLFHRLRSATKHVKGGKVKHVSLNFWCGGQGFLDRGRTFSKVPDGNSRCAVCEGKAIGSGMDGERIINGNAVSYSPRF